MNTMYLEVVELYSRHVRRKAKQKKICCVYTHRACAQIKWKANPGPFILNPQQEKNNWEQIRTPMRHKGGD